MYPRYYAPAGTAEGSQPPIALTPEPAGEDEPQAQHLTFQENARGVSFDTLFGPYLAGAREITVTDPYIRLFFQARNMMELLETVARVKEPGEEVSVHLITGQEEFEGDRQEEYLEQMQTAAAAAGIRFTWTLDDSGSLHARHIVTDTGWKIILDRGLDIFQRYEMNDAFALANRVQEQRAVKAFEVTYVRVDEGQGL